MLNITTVGISLDSGLIPAIFRQMPKMNGVGIFFDSGIIPPKNYFHSKISLIEIASDPQPVNSILYYQIL
jgi:hypothetical protein